MPYQLKSSVKPAGSASIAFSADGLVMAVGDNGYTGAIGGQGGVRIYDKVSGVWTQRGSVLVAADAASSDFYGHSVALSADGNTLVVGCSDRNVGGSDRGGVYVYDRSGTTWVQRGAVLANDGTNTVDQAIAVTLTNVNEAPTITTAAAIGATEGSTSVATSTAQPARLLLK